MKLRKSMFKMAWGSFLFVVLATAGQASVYYVSKQGCDSAAGTKRAPFASIQKAASVMRAGDVCLIAAGTYEETIVPLRSGTAEQPLVFKAADGVGSVILTGTDPIPHSEWTAVDKNLFKCSWTLSLGHQNQVFLNDKPLVEARWPNIGDDLLSPTLAVMGPGTDPDHVVSDKLPDYDYTGGSIWIHAPEYWRNWATEILHHEGSSLQIDDRAPFEGPSRHVAAEGAEFFVFGIRDALDADNEWYYDAENQELYIYRSDHVLPNGEYRVKTRRHALDVSGRQHIKFHGITILGAGILSDPHTEHVLFDRLTVLYPHYDSMNASGAGVVLRGKNNTIQNSEIAYASGALIRMEGENNRLLNSYIHTGNLFGGFTGNVHLRGKNNIISHCTITRSGRTLINYSGMYQALIQHCDLSHAGLLTADLGLTYGTNLEGGNSEVRYNLMHQNHGKRSDKNMGLYYDHGTKNVISHHNIVWGADFAALLINHYAHGHLVYNNTFIGETYGFRSAWGNQYGPDLLNCRFVNNLFAGPFSTTADNYFATNNVTDYTGFDPLNPMNGYEEGFGQGLFIDGITPDTPSGQAGIGAIEYAGMTFETGHDFDNPPDYDFTRSRPTYRNLLRNAAFEHEDHFYPWQSKNGAIPITHRRQAHNHKDVNLGRMGSHSVELPTKGSEIFQRVTGLLAGESYEFISHLRVAEGAWTSNGIRLPDGTELFAPPVTSGAPGWRRSRLSFTLPENVSEVEVFVRRLAGTEADSVYVDELSLNVKF